jgi:hypothetical protein
MEMGKRSCHRPWSPADMGAHAGEKKHQKLEGGDHGGVDLGFHIAEGKLGVNFNIWSSHVSHVTSIMTSTLTL